MAGGQKIKQGCGMGDGWTAEGQIVSVQRQKTKEGVNLNLYIHFFSRKN